MSLVRFQPMTHRQILNTFWQNALDKSSAPERTATRPAVNIAETPDGFRIEVAAPGLAKEDFQVSITDRNVLTIKAQKEAVSGENDQKIHRRDFAYQAFEHSFNLPETVDTDELRASYHQGILVLDLKKRPKNGYPVKTISIS